MPKPTRRSRRTNFHPAIRNCKNTKELVEVAQEERKAKQMLEEVEYLSPTSGEFKQKIAELKRLIQHHLHAEENGIFSQCECMTQEEWNSEF